MLSVHLSLAAVAVAALVLGPRSRISAAVVAAAAALDIALGARVTPALAVVAPLLAFLTAALTLSALIASSGLADRAAVALARRARGNGLVLYALVCGLCALLTAIVSLDGAVVLIVPLIIALHRRYGAPVAPLLLGAVAVANAASIAVPQGNPTNLVVINHLRLSPLAFTAHMLAPGLAAAAICALAVALTDHRALADRLPAAAIAPVAASPPGARCRACARRSRAHRMDRAADRDRAVVAIHGGRGRRTAADAQHRPAADPLADHRAGRRARDPRASARPAPAEPDRAHPPAHCSPSRSGPAPSPR